MKTHGLVMAATIAALLAAAALVGAGGLPGEAQGDGPIYSEYPRLDHLDELFWTVWVFTDSTEVWELARQQGPVKDQPPLRGNFLAFLPGAFLEAVEARGDVRAVAVAGGFPLGRPPAGYDFSRAKRYWQLTISTTSESLRQEVLAQALAEPGFLPSVVDLASGTFSAWLPEPLVPALESSPEVSVFWGGQGFVAL